MDYSAGDPLVIANRLELEREHPSLSAELRLALLNQWVSGEERVREASGRPKVAYVMAIIGIIASIAGLLGKLGCW